jgi:hypothetical protein
MTWGKQNTEAEAHEQLSYAFERGLNFLDTAEMYPIPTEAETQGRTDKYIGSWLKTGKVPRDKVVLATKARVQKGPRCLFFPPRSGVGRFCCKLKGFGRLRVFFRLTPHLRTLDPGPTAGCWLLRETEVGAGPSGGYPGGQETDHVLGRAEPQAARDGPHRPAADPLVNGERGV